MTHLTFAEPLLSAHQERLLARRIEAGVVAGALLEGDAHSTPGSAAELRALRAEGDEAFEQLVQANLRLVQSVAAVRARACGLDADELFQEGVLGLLEAARRYDHERGARFATFALPWIRMRVAEASANRLGEVGLAGPRARRWRQALALSDRLAGELGRTPTAGEVAAAWGRPEASVASLLGWQPVGRLDAPGGPHPTVPGPDVGVPEGLRWSRALARLTHDERAVVELRYGFGGREPASFVATARALGISVATVRRRERSALAVLQRCAELRCAS